ncbi:staufen-like protein, partial [Dinothrombium tinctorium]
MNLGPTFCLSKVSFHLFVWSQASRIAFQEYSGHSMFHLKSSQFRQFSNRKIRRNGKEEIADENIKSPISLVHELTLKRNLVVKFEVVSESGPSHMPSFVTRCIVGDIVIESE